MRQCLAPVLCRIGISTASTVTRTWVGRRSRPCTSSYPKPAEGSFSRVNWPRSQDIQPSLLPSSLKVKKAYNNSCTFPLVTKIFCINGCVIRMCIIYPHFTVECLQNIGFDSRPEAWLFGCLRGVFRRVGKIAKSDY
jgi:hypothetical protein